MKPYLCHVGYHCDPLVVPVYDYSRRFDRRLAVQGRVGLKLWCMMSRPGRAGHPFPGLQSVFLFSVVESPCLDAVPEFSVQPLAGGVRVECVACMNIPDVRQAETLLPSEHLGGRLHKHRKPVGHEHPRVDASHPPRLFRGSDLYSSLVFDASFDSMDSSSNVGWFCRIRCRLCFAAQCTAKIHFTPCAGFGGQSMAQ